MNVFISSTSRPRLRWRRNMASSYVEAMRRRYSLVGTNLRNTVLCFVDVFVSITCLVSISNQRYPQGAGLHD